MNIAHTRCPISLPSALLFGNVARLRDFAFFSHSSSLGDQAEIEEDLLVIVVARTVDQIGELAGSRFASGEFEQLLCVAEGQAEIKLEVLSQLGRTLGPTGKRQGPRDEANRVGRFRPTPMRPLVWRTGRSDFETSFVHASLL